MQSLINRGLLPAGTQVNNEGAVRTDASRGGPIGPVLRDALLEKLCGVSGLGSANALAAVLHAGRSAPPLHTQHVQSHARRQTARRSCV